TPHLFSIPSVRPPTSTPFPYTTLFRSELKVLRADHGDLHKALRTGFAETAKIIAARGGLAIAAHADREKGLLRIPVADHVNQTRSEEHTSELQSLRHLVCRLLLEKKKK